MQRLTNQKQIILEYIKSVHSHPTAEDVYVAVKKKLPRISLGTVYRNLEKFAEDGVILEIKSETKKFDGDTSEHQHFICTHCEKVFDIFENKINLKQAQNKINKIGKIKSLYIYGICRKCQHNKLTRIKNMPCKKRKKVEPKKTPTKKKCGGRKCGSKKK